MLGRKSNTKEELNHGKSAADEQLAAYKKLVRVIDTGTKGKKVQSCPDHR